MSSGYVTAVQDVVNKTHTYMTHFSFFLLLSAGFSGAGALIGLYGPVNNQCRYGFVVAPVVLQAIALVISLVAFMTTCGCWTAHCAVKHEQSPNTILTSESPSRIGAIAGVFQLIGNTASLVLLVLILIRQNGCNDFIFNIINSITSIVVSFISAILTSFSEKDFPRFKIKSINNQKDIYQIKPISGSKQVEFIQSGVFGVFAVRYRPYQRGGAHPHRHPHPHPHPHHLRARRFINRPRRF